MQIIDRKFAIANSLPTYYTGKLCVNGHLAYRYTACGTCAECKNGAPQFRIDPERKSLSERAKVMQDEQNAARAAAAALRERQQRAKEQAQHFTKILTVMDAAEWPGHSQRIVQIVQMTYPDVTREDIVPKNHIKDMVGAHTRYRMTIPSELVALEQTLAIGLHNNYLEESKLNRIAAEPGAMTKTDFEATKKDATGNDERFGAVVRIGEFWYPKELDWGPDPLVHPINTHWWRPRKHYQLIDVDVIKYTSEDEAGECLDLTGEWYNINGDWFLTADVRAAQRNEKNPIQSYLVQPQTTWG